MITLEPVAREQKEILRNLLEKYDYEFSQYDLRDVNELGLFGYDWLDCYWTEPRRWAYFIRVEGKLAGFVMVNDYPEYDAPMDFSLAEFCVLYKYRRQGVGAAAANEIFNLHRGRWQLKRHPKNAVSIAFWDRVIQKYTGGQYVQIPDAPGTEYPDGTPGNILLFDSSEKQA